MKFRENFSTKLRRTSAFATLFFVAFFSGNLRAQSQFQFIRNDSIPVTIGSQQLLFPWAGGLNFGQFSPIDLDQDGTLDLFVFDRTGNKITTYVNQGTPGQVDYVLAPQYVKDFPALHDWAILRDYNCDGKMDIFTSYTGAQQGIAVYENISTSISGLQFQLVANPIITDVTPNSTHNLQALVVTPVDIPAIRDVDNDGDLDVLTYDASGVHVEFHRNMSKENYGVCDSLKFILQTSCWGDFAENTLNANLTLNDTCSNPPIMHGGGSNAYSALHNLHNGSCLECINTDGDNDQDIVIGDISNRYISYGRNGGSSSFAKMDTVDPRYPNYDSTVTMFLFNCAYRLDVDNDGNDDLIFAPNAASSSENFRSAWYYHNTGTDSTVTPHFIKDNFLQDEMIEVGEGAYPRFFDYDNDGDQDLFIGNYGYYNSSGPYPSKIALYKNIGTPSFPSFKLLTDDFANLYASSSGVVCPIPTFGDLDGDGDKDMIVGVATGKLFYYRKDPGPADNFVLVSSNYLGIDVGNDAAPQLVDVDRDGLLDLLIGEQSGNINYYRNTGTSSAANFALINGFFGGVYINQPGFTTGYSVPFLWDNGGSYVLLVGSERGWLNRYDNIDGNLTGTFTRTDSMYVSTLEGLRIAPWVADINNDTLADLVLGNYSGGVSLFKGTLLSGINDLQPGQTFFDIYPNPANESVTVENNLSAGELPAQLSVFTVDGKRVAGQTITMAKERVDISAFASGIYIVALQAKNGVVSYKKLVKQ